LHAPNPENSAAPAIVAVEYRARRVGVTLVVMSEERFVLGFVPVFAFFIAAEGFVLARRRRLVLVETLTNVTMGLGNALLGLVFGGIAVAAYSCAYAHRIATVPHTALAFAALVVLEDLTYYAFHRVAHVSRLWWAAHEAHHSSEAYDFSTAVRQTWTGWVHGWVFWLPLPLLGFPVEWVLLQQGVSLVYQFFVHTELVGKLGPLEWVLNTPSHHRVHHATNLEYLDKNFAGIFIVWDRLFGTFEPERAPCRYGILKPLPSRNPLGVAFAQWVSMGRDVARARSWRGRLGYLFAPPGWNEDGTGVTTRVLVERGASARSDARRDLPPLDRTRPPHRSVRPTFNS
jgi:sterol desaturase/sphingolipid hydroxylase (fatty acid hydroxylase superfamily)